MAKGTIEDKENKEETKKKVGRPSKYEYETLKKILLQFANENLEGEITISKLVKYSGLPIQAWRFNKDIKKDIERLNAMTTLSYDDVVDLGLPSAEDIVNRHYKNRDRLTKAVSDLIEICQTSYGEILKLRKVEEELGKVKGDLEIYKAKSEKFEKEMEYYKNEMMKLTLKTTNALGRSEIGAEKNVIDLKEYTETNSTFADLFKE